MSKIGAQDNDPFLEEVSNLSLEKATNLQKFNNILDQILKYNSSKMFLKEEGLFRIPGSKADIENVYKRMMKNPSLNQLENNEKKFIAIEHNLTGLIRTGLNDPSIQNDQLKQVFNIIGPNMSLKEIIESLKDEGLLEEAKILHNFVHLCHLIISHKETTKMTLGNISLSIGKSIALFFGQDLTSNPNFMSSFQDPHFAKTFSQVYPEDSRKLAEQYVEKFPPLSKQKEPLAVEKEIKKRPPIISNMKNKSHVTSKKINNLNKQVDNIKKQCDKFPENPDGQPTSDQANEIKYYLNEVGTAYLKAEAAVKGPKEKAMLKSVKDNLGSLASHIKVNFKELRMDATKLLNKIGSKLHLKEGDKKKPKL